MRLQTSIAASLTGLSLIIAPAANARHQAPDRDFNFTLHSTDVFCWISGECKGAVIDRQKKMAQALDELLASARRKLDLSFYGVNRQNWFLRRLTSLDRRGIRIRAVVDQMAGDEGDWKSENFTYPDTALLPDILGRNAVQPDVDQSNYPRASSIMHNKWLVVDDESVWVGSTNISHTCLGAEYNANSSLVIKSKALAALFSEEFRNMFESKLFSVSKSSTSQNRTIAYGDGTEVSVYFSPQDDAIVEAIIPFIRSATSTLDIGMFYLTDEDIARELILASQRGVKIRLLYDAVAASHPSTKHRLLREIGIDVKVENFGGKMHLKSAVADHRHVLTGSMNWSGAGAHTNDETTLVIKNNTALAAQADVYFDRLWDTIPLIRSHKTIVDPRAEGPETINSCFDGVDNDHDGRVDANDWSCKPQSGR